MLKSLSWKLILAFMLVAFTSAALVAVFIRLTSADQLTQLILDQQRGDLQQALVDYYTANGSWSGVTREWRQIQSQAVPQTQTQSNDHSPSSGRDRRGLFGLADTKGVVIVGLEPGFSPGARLSAADLKAGLAVEVGGKQVGTIITARQTPGLNPEETLFLERTNHALLLASLAAVLVALVLGILLARTLTRPIQALTRAAQGIAAGQSEQQVKVSSQDEIGQLAAAFNQMSQEVAQANRLRRQMTADIAHDLRTPLTVIGGYVESMRDGVLQPTPERLTLIYAEIERLQRMVGDLRMLSQVDAGELPLHPQAIAPLSLLERAAGLFQHPAEQQAVTMRVQAAANLPEIRVDEARMMQVMDNLISNALRYTPSGGTITLAAQASAGKVIFSVRDTGQGIAPEELPHIFNRFYRADRSRHSESGESGLGLAIVKALVEAHGGKVWAESVLEKGTTIFVQL